jgi:hypothetical protein
MFEHFEILARKHHLGDTSKFFGDFDVFVHDVNPFK